MFWLSIHTASHSFSVFCFVATASPYTTLILGNFLVAHCYDIHLETAGFMDRLAPSQNLQGAAGPMSPTTLIQPNCSSYISDCCGYETRSTTSMCLFMKETDNGFRKDQASFHSYRQNGHSTNMARHCITYRTIEGRLKQVWTLLTVAVLELGARVLGR